MYFITSFFILKLKHKQDEAAKRQRIVELKDKRRQEKLLRQQKECERLQQIENQHKANMFYRHKLLTKFGMDRFKMLIKLKKKNQKKAEQFSKMILIRHSFKLWQLHVHQLWDKRKRLADEHYHRNLKKLAFNLWKEVFNLIEIFLMWIFIFIFFLLLSINQCR